MKNLKLFILFVILLSQIQKNTCANIENYPNSIKVGVYDNPPKIFINEKNQPEGIFIDILKNIAKNENLNIEYINGDWDELTEKLKTGEIDILPDMARNKYRDTLYTFNHISVLSTWLEVFSVKGYKINTFAELNGRTIAVLKGSFQENYFNNTVKKLYNINYKVFPIVNYRQVGKNEIDAIIADRFFLFSKYNVDNIIPTGILFNANELYYGFYKKTNPFLIKIFDKELSKLKNNPKSVYYNSLSHWLSFPNHTHSLPKYIILITLLSGKNFKKVEPSLKPGTINL